MSIDTPPSPVPADADSLIAAAKGMGDTEIQALVARMVIDSLGRPWDPLKHPRDSKGRFIETFAEIRGLFRTSGGAHGSPQVSGRVVAFDHNGDVWVRLDHVAPGYTEHSVGDIIPIKANDMEALDKLATIPKSLDDNQRSQIEALAARMESRNPGAATALRRAADPANTAPMAQLIDLHEARDLLDQDGSPEAITVRDMVWDLSDQLGDHPSNEENLHAAQAMIRDHLAKNPTENAEAIARLDQLRAPAPSAPSAPDAAQVMAAQLHGLADRLQDRNPADAVHVRNVAAALGEVGVSGQTPEARDAALERASEAALRINTTAVKKRVIADIKHMRDNPPGEAAPAEAPKATLPPPPPAASLPPTRPDAGGLLDWARGVAKPGGGIKPHENPDDATPEKLMARQAQVDAEIEALRRRADAHDGVPTPPQAQRLDALVKEHDAIEARLPAPGAPAGHIGPTMVGRLIELAKGGGFTYDPRSGTFKADGFAVARQGMGAEPFPADAPDAFDQISDFIDANWDTFQSDPGAYLGGWESNGQIYLDVPDVLESREEGIAEGTKRFEIAIADLAAYARGEDGEIRLQYAEQPPVGTPAHDDWTDLEGVRHVNESAAADSAPAGAGGDEGPVQAPSGTGPGSEPGPDAAGPGTGDTGPVDVPISSSPDDTNEDEVPPSDETVEAVIPALPPLGDLGLGIQWEDMPHGTVLRGNTFPHLDDIKAVGGFKFLPVPGEFKRNGDPLKAWAAIGAPEERQAAIGRLADRLGLPDPMQGPDLGDEYPPTEQQQAIIDAVNTGQDVAVRALAGTGKTSTLKMIARRLFKSDPNKRIVYVAFNKSIQEEAQKTMPPNVEARTGDSIAYATLSPEMKAKFEDKSTLRRNADIAAFLGIAKPLDTGVPGEKPMQPDEQAMRVMRAIEQYAISADDILGVEHFKNLDPKVAKELIPFAEKAWADLYSDTGRIKLNFSHITKMWALSKPDFRKTTSGLRRKADIVFFDEAQDINPVMAKVIADQKIQKVYVGDSNQAIYAFRGAVDELDNVKVDHDLPLTKSWRFGPEIAGMGNRFLALLGAKHRIEGAGPAGNVVEPYTMTDPDAILVRSNAGAIGEILQAQTEGKIVGVPKGTKGDLRRLVDTARWLQRGGPAPTQLHDDLAAFRNWDEVAKAADAGDDPKVKMLYRIIEDTGVDKLNDLVNRLVETGDNRDNRTPDMYVTTAHKAKGLEWDKVKIGGDFWGPRKDPNTGEIVMPSPEEMRLAYVAVTRAMKELDPGSLAWVYDYTDDNGGTTPSTTEAPPAPPNIASSPARWIPDYATAAPGEASRPLGPSAPQPDEIATKAADLGLAPETVDAIRNGTPQQIEEALSKDERFAAIQHTYARAVGTTIRTPEAEKARDEWLALQRDVLIPLGKRGVRTNFIRPKTEVPPPPPNEPTAPEGWVKNAPEPGVYVGDMWRKGSYVVFPNDDGTLRVAEFDANEFPIWRADGTDWADIERQVNEREQFKAEGGLPQDARDKLAAYAEKLGFGNDVVDAIKTGTPDAIENALAADPNYNALHAAYVSGMEVDRPKPKQKQAMQDWLGFESQVLLELQKARLLTHRPTPELLKQERPDTGLPPAPEPNVPEVPAPPARPAAPAGTPVPAYSGELRPLQPRDIAEVHRAADAAQRWANGENREPLARVELQNPWGDENIRKPLDEAWGALDAAMRDGNLTEAQHQLDTIQAVIDAPEVNPAAKDEHQAYVDQVRGVLDKLQQRAEGQFEIPGVARTSEAPRIEQSAPDLNAAFEDVLQNDPGANARLKAFHEALVNLRDQVEGYGAQTGDERPIQDIIDALDAQDYHRMLGLTDDLLGDSPGGTTNKYEGFGGFEDVLNAYDGYGGVGVKHDWQAMLDGNPDLAKYNPDAPASPQFPTTTIDTTSETDPELRRWVDIVARIDGEFPDDSEIGAIYNAVVQDQDVTDPAVISEMIDSFRRKVVAGGDSDEIRRIDGVLADNPSGGGPKSDVPGPYDPKADAEVIIPNPPKGGGEVKDGDRILDQRVRGEIEEAMRGVGIPELPDRYDLDRNGVLVFPFDVVDVPAAGNQGPQGGLRRPAGLGQVRRIHKPDKNGVVYIEVAFYNPDFVNLPDVNAVKAAGGLKNNDVFRKWDRIRLDKVQKVDPENPDAKEFLGHLGPEEARQFAGRNAGRLAQNRGRVRPELERMANAGYIGDRYAPDANGLPVGKGDVVVWEGKKYEVIRVNVDAGNDTRIEIAPVGANGEPELQAGGKHAEPYARMVQFYDKPLTGNARPAVTVDELKDLVRRLDANKEYIVGQDLRDALDEGDLKQITKAMGADPAIQNYVADGRAYIQNYVDRLLRANLEGNYDEVKRNEPEMVRKDKNDLLNALAAMDGRFLEGTGADRHIVREIPEAGPDQNYQGNRPEVLMPLWYVRAKKAVQDLVIANPGDAAIDAFQQTLDMIGHINLDEPVDWARARNEAVVLRRAADRQGAKEFSDALYNLLTQMNRWRNDQDARRAIRQGGPGGQANLPPGRTVAPGLVREPGLSKKLAPPAAPAAPAGPTPEDKLYADQMANEPGMRDRYMRLRDNINAAISALENAGEPDGAEYLRTAVRALFDGRYAEGYRALDHITAPPERHPNHDTLQRWYQAMADAGVYYDFRSALNRVRSDWPNGDWPATPAPAPVGLGRMPEKFGPAVNYPKVGNITDDERDRIKNAQIVAERAGNDARAQMFRAIYNGGPANKVEFDKYMAQLDELIAQPFHDTEIDQMKELLERYVGKAPAAPAAPPAPAEPLNLGDVRVRIADAFEKRYEELRADRKNNAARRNAVKVDEAAGEIDKALMQANMADAKGDTAGRDARMRDARDTLDGIRADNPDLAAAVDSEIAAMEQHFQQKDASHRVQQYLDEAEKFHNAETPDPSQRDRMLRAALDQVDMIESEFPDLAANFRSQIDALRAQYDADDKERARAVPIGRTDAIDNFDAQVQAERKRLRDAGAHTDARDLVAKAEAVAEPLNDAEDAHKAGNKEERDAKMDEARAAIPDLEAINPDLGEAARQAVEGNAARFAKADAGPATGTPSGPGTGPIPHDPANGKVKPTGDSWMEQQLHLFEKMSYADIVELLDGLDPDDSSDYLEWNGLHLAFNGERGVVPSIWVTDPKDPSHRFLIKGDKKRGMQAEMDLAQMYRAMGLYMPRVFQFGIAADFYDEQRGNQFKAYPFAMEAAGPEFGINNEGTIEDVFGWGKPDLGQLNLQDPSDAFKFYMANMFGANTDRHNANAMYGTYVGADGKTYGALLVIDNGYGLGGGAGLHDISLMMEGGYDSHHCIRGAAMEWVGGVTDQELTETLTEWATRMRDEAKARLNALESKAHAQHIIAQADTVLSDLPYWVNVIRRKAQRGY